MFKITFVIIASYLIGSVSPSIILGKFLKGIDIREHGSGNAGSTNAFRVLGKWAGITVLLLDIFKGYFAVKFISSITGENPVISTTLIAILSGFAPIILVIQRQRGINVPLELIIFTIIIPVFIIYTHRTNIKRLMRGEENKIKLSR